MGTQGTTYEMLDKIHKHIWEMHGNIGNNIGTLLLFLFELIFTDNILLKRHGHQSRMF
jgi:hypothetical protein